MRDAFVAWLAQITHPFWNSIVSVDDFVSALQQTIYMVIIAFFLVQFGAFYKQLPSWLHDQQEYCLIALFIKF